jgi:patatin-related protein
VLGAVSGIPRREPILDDLLEVTRLNERVQRIRDIVEVSFDRVAQKIDETLEQSLSSQRVPDADTVGTWQPKLNDAARQDAGTTYATYLRSKISDVVDRFATTACRVCSFPADANQAMLVRAVCRCWAENEGLFARAAEPTSEQIAFLHDFDLDYGVRRLQFVVAGLNAWYAELGTGDCPAREQIDAVKARLWQAIDELRAAMAGNEFTSELRDGVTTCFPAEAIGRYVAEEGFAPEEYARSRQGELRALSDDLRAFLRDKLQHFSARLYDDLVRMTNGWSWPRRKELLVRYLGFPLWDVLLFPIQSVVDAGERDAVEVIRMSPRDTRLLRPAKPGQKLEGVGFGHFRAFFARRYRENDYLWGRLDAAERLIGIVLGTDHPDFRRWCGRAFLAILDEEEAALPHVTSLVSGLRTQAEALAAR